MCPLFAVRLPGPFTLCAAVPFPPARDSLEPALSATIPVHSLSCSDVDAEYTPAAANCQFSRHLGVHPNRGDESLDSSARKVNPLRPAITLPACVRRALSQDYLYGCHMLLALQRVGGRASASSSNAKMSRTGRKRSGAFRVPGPFFYRPFGDGSIALCCAAANQRRAPAPAAKASASGPGICPPPARSGGCSRPGRGRRIPPVQFLH